MSLSEKFIEFLSNNFEDYDIEKGSYATGELTLRTIAYANKEGGFTILSENSLTVPQRLELESLINSEKNNTYH